MGEIDDHPINTCMEKKEKLYWADYMDKALVDALLSQQLLGNRTDNIFTSTAYDNMLKDLSEKLGKPLERYQLKSRIKILKRQFHDCYNIFKGLNGFAWSSETKMWHAKPEQWTALRMKKPAAAKWMITPMYNYDKLLLLFSNPKPKKIAHRADVSKKQAGERPISENDQFSDGNGTENEVTHKPEDINDMNGGTSIEANSQVVPPRSAISPSCKKRKILQVSTFEREFKSIREAIKEVVEVIKESNLIAERGRARVYSEEEVFTELINIGVESHLRFKAYNFLIANAGRTRAFFGVPVDERKEYLLYMMFFPDEDSL